MKNKITRTTKIPRTGIKAWLRLLPLMFLGSFGYSAQAQTYCGASQQWGCGNTRAGNVTDITISDASGKTLTSWSGGCTQNAPIIANPGAPIDITAGEVLTINVKGSTWAAQGWSTNVGVWLDIDRNGSFSGPENLVDPENGPLTRVGTAGKSTNVNVPCFSNTGAARLRFRGSSQVYQMTRNNGCGGVGTYGNSVDVLVNLKVGTPPVADFVVPSGLKYERSAVTFNSTTQSAAYVQTWIFNSADVNVKTTGSNGKAIWNTPGDYNVELKQDYCGQKDSITKKVTIVAPTSVPTADFIASSNEVELYYDVQMFDLSTQGAYVWAWEVTDPDGNVYNDANQNPIFNLDVVGDWDFCLTSENSLGASTKNCKTAYVKCIPTTQYYLGPNNLGESRNGTLFDHAGPTANYANGRKTTIDYFKISPCGASAINFSFDDLNLQDAGDKFRIFDASIEDFTKEITPAGGITGANYRDYEDSVFSATSGAMYITFESNGAGTNRGFIGKWESVLNPPTDPTVDFTFPYSTVGVGVPVLFEGDIKDAQGEVDYDWEINSVSGYGNDIDFSTIFATDGTYNVCLTASTACNKKSGSKCKNITIITPSTPGELDYVADQVRPKVLAPVSFTTTTDYATKFKWSIFPLSYEFVAGTNDSSRNPVIEFKQGGAYTFTLSAWNFAGGKAATLKKVIKNKYVVVLDPCTPLVNITSSDVGITNVTLMDNSGAELINNESDAGEQGYSDYTQENSATMSYGKTYDLTVSRKTTSNPANYKAWIDFNIDGVFDAGEEVLNSGSINSLTATASFTVPKRSLIFEGKTRMRVGASYSNFSNTPCGVNQVGEFEDYEIVLVNDGTIPVITLIGSDTISVEKGGSTSSCWNPVAGVNYNASDEALGDLNSEVDISSDLDCTLPGIYTICYDVEDASGNQAATKCRTVYVVLDRTPPSLTINSANPLVFEQCSGAFTAPDAIATDIVDGNLSTAVNITGTVDGDKVGDYQLTYEVQDAQGNKTSQVLDVQVRDRKAPSIEYKTAPIVDASTFNIQINSTFVDEVYTADGCNGIIATTKTALLGQVDATKKGIYPIQYTSTDASGNAATEDGYVINYSVDDFIAPVVNLKTSDTLIHDVNTPYVSQPVEFSDNYYDNSKVSLVKTGTVDAYALGTYSEVYTATDESGNTSSKTRTIKVVDRVAPTINVNPVNACVGAGFNTLSGLVLEDNYYGPSVLAPLVEIVDHNINTMEAGVYYINYRVTDPSGNRSKLTPGVVYVNYPPNCQNTFLSNSDVSLNERISLYPNPAENNRFSVSYSVANADDVAITVSDMSGRVVYQTVAQDGGLGRVEIDLTGKSHGVYNVTIRNAGSVANKQVVLK